MSDSRFICHNLEQKRLVNILQSLTKYSNMLHFSRQDTTSQISMRH